MKVFVHVDYPSGMEVSKRNTEHLGEKDIIVMRKVGLIKKHPGWSFEVPEGAIRTTRGFMGLRTFYHVYVKPEAECAMIMRRDLDPKDIPMWDKFQSDRMINRKLLEKRGEEPKEQKPNVILWIIIFLSIANLALSVLLSGKVKFG